MACKKAGTSAMLQFIMNRFQRKTVDFDQQHARFCNSFNELEFPFLLSSLTLSLSINSMMLGVVKIA
jgi:hypothetical protein